MLTAESFTPTVAEQEFRRQLTAAAHESAALRDRVATLEPIAATVRDRTNHIRDLQRQLGRRERQVQAVIGMTQRADVDDAGRMAMLLVDIRAALGVVS
jgi:hypothetical protein